MRRTRLAVVGVAAGLIAGLLTGCGPPGSPWRSELVSLNSSGSDGGNGYSVNPVFDPSGTKIAFESLASDLGANDVNENYDVYVRDLVTGTTTLVSVNASGTASGNHPSLSPSFSPDGTKVAFHSRANDLVPGDDDDADDIFIRDLTTSTTTLVTPVASANGSRDPVFSPDGTRLVFVSDADNLVPNDANGWGDIFLYDLATATTSLVSLNAAGTTSADDVSGDPWFDPTGTRIAFFSRATDLTTVADFNFTFDVFVRDLSSGTTTLLSINKAGTETGNQWSLSPRFNRDGTKVAFQSQASDIDERDANFFDWDVFVSDLTTGATEMVSLDQAGSSGGDYESYGPVFSPVSDEVAFISLASNLVAGDDNNFRDVFLRDLDTGTTTLISVGRDGLGANSQSTDADFSPDGKLVTFQSNASNLVPRDSNGKPDLFARDRSAETTVLVSARADGQDSANDESSRPGLGRPSFDPRGGRLAFVSLASDLGSTDTNGAADIYLASLRPPS